MNFRVDWLRAATVLWGLVARNAMAPSLPTSDREDDRAVAVVLSTAMKDIVISIRRHLSAFSHARREATFSDHVLGLTLLWDAPTNDAIGSPTNARLTFRTRQRWSRVFLRAMQTCDASATVPDEWFAFTNDEWFVAELAEMTPRRRAPTDAETTAAPPATLTPDAAFRKLYFQHKGVVHAIASIVYAWMEWIVDENVPERLKCAELSVGSFRELFVENLVGSVESLTRGYEVLGPAVALPGEPGPAEQDAPMRTPETFVLKCKGMEITKHS